MHVPPLHIEKRLKEMEDKHDFAVNDRIGMEIMKKKELFTHHRTDPTKVHWSKRIIIKLRKKAVTWNSVLIGGSLIFIEGLLLAHGILRELEDDYIKNEPAFYMSCWMFCLIPYFMFTGIGIISIDENQGFLGHIINSPLFAVITTVIFSFIK